MRSGSRGCAIVIYVLGLLITTYVIGIATNQPPSLIVFATYSSFILLGIYYQFHSNSKMQTRDYFVSIAWVVIFLAVWYVLWFGVFFFFREYKDVLLSDVLLIGSSAFTFVLLCYWAIGGDDCVDATGMVIIAGVGGSIGFLLLMIIPLFFLNWFHSWGLIEGIIYGLSLGILTGYCTGTSCRKLK